MKMEQAISGTSAATYKVMEPHWIQLTLSFVTWTYARQHLNGTYLIKSQDKLHGGLRLQLVNQEKILSWLEVKISEWVPNQVNQA